MGYGVKDLEFDFTHFEDWDECYSYWFYFRIIPVPGRYRELLSIPTQYGYDFFLRRITTKYSDDTRGTPIRIVLKTQELWRDRTFEPMSIPLVLESTPAQVVRNAAGNSLSGIRKLHKSINYLWARRDQLFCDLEGWGLLANELPEYIDILLEGVYKRAQGVET